ncbi:M20 family metallopeptidase [Paraburkholderia kururiensis]|uniref:M20 family metallopeptidase n=1 Tax=Paraburkholderia kururiensis TaxID=984307 RepID=A0ABZ0WKS1_9BURK|nr:M20 family metallopeptidase [Paraburkholderia kururiensis]WQD77962.1 M20 family metallopeptidase [Paraburkholderia kururiensis]
MSRSRAIDMATSYFDDGRFMRVLDERVAMRTESQLPDSQPALYAYLREQMVPALAALGFTSRIVDNPVPGKSPFLLAERIEDPAALTVLTYGHGDVVPGHDAQWREGLAPWRVVVDGDRWYGRGTADNKGQHTINLAALEQVIEARGGRLGYNVKAIIEMGEETGSPGLAEVCAQHREALAADVFIASDGPRVAATRPTLFLGSRGNFNFTLQIKLRDGAHHSGNWGGLLRSPGIRLANALATMVDAHGRILVKGLLPETLPESVREALRTIEVGGGPNDPEIDPAWGEPDLTPAERVFAWNSLEILAFRTGNPDAPVNAIPGHAVAYCQLRYVVGTDTANLVHHIREHLDAYGFTEIDVSERGTRMAATRLDPDDAWVRWCLASIQHTTGEAPALLPNLGGSLPNDVFAHILGLPTLWVPHSYAACSQHAPNEHLLASIARQSLQIMAGLFWDLAEQGPAIREQKHVA